MPRRTLSRHVPAPPAVLGFRAVILHDDHLTARRGTLLARRIADDLGWGRECEIKLWNTELLDTPFGRVAANAASIADLVIVALRDATRLSSDLKRWLEHWLAATKDNSAALIALIEGDDEPAAEEARAFLERAARSAGKAFYTQPADTLSSDTAARSQEFLWVL